MATPQHLIAPRSKVSQEMREKRQMHRGMTFWLTGLSGAGKSTLAHIVEAKLFSQGYNIVVFDGDAIRKGLCCDLGFSPPDRRENNRRIAEVAKLFVRNSTLCLCAFISPAAEFRQMARDIIGDDNFREIFIQCSPEECERRDVKGFYQKARQGQIENYTGVSSGYEPPEQPDLLIQTDTASIEECAEQLFTFIIQQSSNNHTDETESRIL